MSSREKIFSALRDILGDAAGVLPASPAATTGSAAPGIEPVSVFADMASRAGSVVRAFDSPGALALWFVEHCRSSNAARVWLGDIARYGLEPDALAATLQQAGIETMRHDTLPPEGAARDFLARCDISLTGSSYACADTGIVAVESGASDPRAASLLPLAHVAILRRRDIHPDLATAWAGRGGSDVLPPAAVTLIGGPSRTADIEKVLVTGVHGPKTFTVCLVD